MSFQTASALLRGQWLIDKRWTINHLPLVAKILKGEAVDFGSEKSTEKIPVALSHKSGAVYSVGYYTDLSRLPEGSVVMLTVAGPILKYGDYCSYGSVDYTALINRLANAGNVAAILINMDSPGGQAAGTASFANAIKSADTVKPVVGFVDDGIACSAGYWLLSACREIYVTQKTDWLGSIGVYTTIMDVYGYFESQGLKIKDIYAPQSSDKNLDYREALEGKEDLLKEELRVLCQQFIDTVSANRGNRLVSDDWKTGKVYYAKQAEKVGLIDGIKPIEEIIGRVNKLVKNSSSYNASTKTNYTMKFPKIASLLSFKSEEESNENISLEAHGESLEAVITERDALKTENADLKEKNAQLEASLAETEATNTTLAENNASLVEKNSNLTEKVTKLEGEVATLKEATAGNFSNANADADPQPSGAADVDPMSFGFQQEIMNRVKN